MKKAKYLLVLLSICLIMCGCTKKNEKLKEPEITKSTPLLFEVAKEGSNNTLYLFGSIHAAEETMYPLPDYVMNAYQKSDTLAVEFDLIAYGENMENQVEMVSKFINPEGKEIKEYISNDVYEKGVEIFKNSGFYISAMDYYQPIIWQSLIENIILGETNLSTEYGIDNYFLTRSKEDQKKILELESADYQYQVLLGFDIDTQVYLLEQSIREYDNAKEDMKKLYEAYKKGNQEELEKVAFTDEEENEYEKEYNQKLITIRNKNMTKLLETSFEEGNHVFCTVGLAHIIGEDGIVELLEQEGYTVKVVK